MTRFAFAFSRPLSWPLTLLGVTRWTAHVDVGDEFAVRFGPWSLTTPLSNVVGAEVTGPYLPFKVLGPHISLADRGATFGTTWRRGVCVRFREPVPAALPSGLLRHPAVTVTVADAEGLVALLERRPAGAPGRGDELLQVLAPVPDAAGETEVTAVEGTPDAAVPVPAPVPTPPAADGAAPTPVASPPAKRTTTRRPAKRATPEHPTPADMPRHTDTEKVPGVTPPEDEDLPGPDEPRDA